MRIIKQQQLKDLALFLDLLDGQLGSDLSKKTGAFRCNVGIANNSRSQADAAHINQSGLNRLLQTEQSLESYKNVQLQNHYCP